MDISNFPVVEILIILTTIILSIYSYFSYSYTYWSRRKVPYLPPKFPLGNIKTLMPKGISVGIESAEFYNQFKKLGINNFGGIYTVTEPTFIPIHPDYVRDILSVDFAYFSDRGIYQNEVDDPISCNLFSQKTEKWKTLRVKLTPTFTSGKMKMMFNNMKDCSKNMLEHLEQNLLEENLDIKKIASSYTIDVIGSTAFGINCNSFKEPDAEFQYYLNSLFQPDFLLKLRFFFTINLPKLALKLGITNSKKDVVNFFNRVIRESVTYRENNKIARDDFLHLLIELKNKTDEKERITMDEIVAQCFLFFLAGFETSASTMTFALYEIAQNEEIQSKIQTEIQNVLQKHENELTYDSLAEMKYLGQTLDETLRLYPTLATLNRVCTKDYELKNTPEKIIIAKGTPVMIPVFSLHRDAEYFPDPLKFDPDRFSSENKKNRHSHVYLPFGEGARNCIGLRFGLMQTKIGLVNILKNYKVELGSKSPEGTLELQSDTFVLTPVNNIYLKLTKIQM